MSAVDDEVIVPGPNGDEPTLDPAEVVHQQGIAITVMRQRVIELELELLNTRCELAARDNPR